MEKNLHPVLSQVTLGYSPMIDKHRAITALRLTVFPLHADKTPDSIALLAALGEVWPADGGRVSLNVASESLLQGLMKAALPLNMMVEVPSFMASDPGNAEALLALYKAGNTLLIKGLPTAPLPREVLPCFAYSIIDLADERRDGMPPPGGVSRNIPHVQDGVRSMAQMTDAFGRGGAWADFFARGWARIVARAIAFAVDYAIFGTAGMIVAAVATIAWLVGLAFALGNRSLALHDRLARTRVVFGAAPPHARADRAR